MNTKFIFFITMLFFQYCIAQISEIKLPENYSLAGAYGNTNPPHLGSSIPFYQHNGFLYVSAQDKDNGNYVTIFKINMTTDEITKIENVGGEAIGWYYGSADGKIGEVKEYNGNLFITGWQQQIYRLDPNQNTLTKLGVFRGDYIFENNVVLKTGSAFFDLISGQEKEYKWGPTIDDIKTVYLSDIKRINGKMYSVGGFNYDGSDWNKLFEVTVVGTGNVSLNFLRQYTSTFNNWNSIPVIDDKLCFLGFDTSINNNYQIFFNTSNHEFSRSDYFADDGTGFFKDGYYYFRRLDDDGKLLSRTNGNAAEKTEIKNFGTHRLVFSIYPFLGHGVPKDVYFNYKGETYGYSVYNDPNDYAKVFFNFSKIKGDNTVQLLANKLYALSANIRDNNLYFITKYYDNYNSQPLHLISFDGITFKKLLDFSTSTTNTPVDHGTVQTALYKHQNYLFYGTTSGLYKIDLNQTTVQNLMEDDLFYKTLDVKDNQVDKTNIFPNPTTGILKFSSPLSDIHVYDFSGKLIKNFSGKQKEINISDLKTGNYLIKGSDINQKTVTQKIIKK